jgi:hypothetical protein
MKYLRVACFSAVTLFPGLALAAALQPGQVGALQAVYDFCGKVDPSRHPSFDGEAKLLYGGSTSQQIAALRKGTEYQRGYSLYSSVLPNLSHGDAMTDCAAMVPKPRRMELGPQKRGE